MLSAKVHDRILQSVDDLRPELVEFLQRLIRIDTTVPPGRNYREAAEFVGAHLKQLGYDVELVTVPEEYVVRYPLAAETGDASGKPLPRVNVFARMEGKGTRPVKHFTGHLDVVPPGQGWTRDPFGGEIEGGRIYGRGATDMKSGVAAQIYAVEAVRRAGFQLKGTIEQSATVDEEIGGYTGLGYLVNAGYIQKTKQDYVLYTECLDVDGICIGHRGTIEFTLSTTGRVGHSCMPQFAINAVDKMVWVINALNTELRPKVEARISKTPIVPEGSKMSNLMPIWIDGFAHERPPCTIAPLCTAYFNRYFNPEEKLDGVREELMGFLDELRHRDSELGLEYVEHDAVDPVLVPTDNEFVKAYQDGVKDVLGRESHFKLSPGTDDQHFVVVDGGIDTCIIYGPGVLNMAHLADEYVPVDDLVNSAKVMALATAQLLGVA